MTAQVVSTVIMPLLCYYFIVVKELNLFGLGMAFNLTQFTLFVVVTLYSNCISQIKEALVLPSINSLLTIDGYLNYLALGLPIMVMVCSEWWVHESMVLIAGTLGVDEQAT